MIKYVIVTFLTLSVFSCCVQRKSNTHEDITDEHVYEYVDTVFVESYPDEELLYENGDLDNEYTTPDILEYKRIWNIEDNVDYGDVVDLGFGIIAYNIPSDLRVNRWSTIRLRVSSGIEIESLLIGNRGIPIVDSLSNDKIVIESIEIDSSMSAKLYADSDFFLIELTTSEIQKISDRGYTEWIWRAKPLKAGDHYIKMIIRHSGKDTVVYEKTIDVSSNWKFSFWTWFSKWWQAIMTAVVIPILIPLFRRKKS